jgi:hypothetical protein
MTQDIIGIDVTIEFADRTQATGHISPVGVHIRKPQDARLRPLLDTMRASVEDRLKPYKSLKVSGTVEDMKIEGFDS